MDDRDRYFRPKKVFIMRATVLTRRTFYFLILTFYFSCVGLQAEEDFLPEQIDEHEICFESLYDRNLYRADFRNRHSHCPSCPEEDVTDFYYFSEDENLDPYPDQQACPNCQQLHEHD